MAQRSSSSGQRRAQGGGRTPNSEPKLQVFKDFNGVNFENASWNGKVTDPTPINGDEAQTDLQMNYVYLQNNVSVASNKTLETRDNIVPLFDAPADRSFMGPVCLVGPNLYAALNDDDYTPPGTRQRRIGYASLDDRYENTGPITLDNIIYMYDDGGIGGNKTWTGIYHYDDKLIALTEENVIWTGDMDGFDIDGISCTQGITDPTTDFNGHLTGMGSLVLSLTATEECPFRIALAHTYVNKFGPTKLSPSTVFYANHPMSEWHSGCYLRIDGSTYAEGLMEAIELYYSTDNAMEMLFLGRVDIPKDNTVWPYVWTYDCYGYIDSTSMWPTANLIAPTENYTRGVPASKACCIDGRMYFWGDKDQPQRLYIGGNPGNLLSVSPGTGGGFVDVEPGTSQEVRHVCKYKTQSGNSIVTMLCDAPNSRKEQRFNLVENSISLSNEQNMKSWQAEQVAGAVGCKSYDGVVVCQDGLYSVSRYGLALTTMTMEYNSQIKTTYVSDQIKPVFVDSADKETRLRNAMLLECDGVVYMAMGASSDEEGNLDNVIFCYDIDLKAWWTHTLNVDSPILNLFHVDWEGQREGIGIVTKNKIYMLPTTDSDEMVQTSDHTFLIESAALSTQMPQQGWQYLSQLEFHFDRFVGECHIHVQMIDMFGRKITVKKLVNASTEQFDYVVRMRIDQRVMSYVIKMTGTARFRLTHWIARVYTLSNKIGQVWGFDDSISHRSSGSVHPTFKSYNDIRKAIFT